MSIWRTPDVQPPVHPFKKSLKFLWEVLLIPFRIILSILKFLVILLCIITSMVWVIPWIILSVGWAAAVFVCAGDRCGGDEDDEDDDFDNFLWWGVISMLWSRVFFRSRCLRMQIHLGFGDGGSQSR